MTDIYVTFYQCSVMVVRVKNGSGWWGCFDQWGTLATLITNTGIPYDTGVFFVSQQVNESVIHDCDNG